MCVGDQYFGIEPEVSALGTIYVQELSYECYRLKLLVPSNQQASKSRVLKVSANYTVTPHLINEAGFGFTLYTSGQTNPLDGKTFTTGLGLTGLQNLFYNGVPELDFYNLTSLNVDRLSSLTELEHLRLHRFAELDAGAARSSVRG